MRCSFKLIKMNSDFLPVPKFLEKRFLSEIKKHLPYSTKAYNMIMYKQMGVFTERNLYFRSLTGVIDPSAFAIENVYLGSFKGNFQKSFAVIATENKILESVLRMSKLFEWEKPMLFSTVSDYQLETYQKVAIEKNGNIYLTHSPLCLYSLQDFSKLQEVTIPPNVEVVLLSKEHTSLIYDIWCENPFIDQQQIELIIKSGNGVGVINKETNELISCFMLNAFGSLGLLFTKEEYRGKGYARIVIAALVHQIKDKGYFIPCVDIQDTNERSKYIFEDLGFEPVFQYYLARYIPNCMKLNPKFEKIVSLNFNV